MKYKYKLYGAILGDLAGQPFEFPPMKGPYDKINIHNPKSHITDDTVMTLATAAFILGDFKSAKAAYRSLGRRYPEAGYGKNFKKWLKNPRYPIGNSWGNGCIMRISPFLYVEDSLPMMIDSVRCSHHSTISYQALNDYHTFSTIYDTTSATLVRDRRKIGIPVTKFTKFDVRADATVFFCTYVAAINTSVRKGIIEAIKAGGDTDTNASIVGELINSRFGGITKKDADYVESKLDPYLLDILKRFNNFCK